MPIPAHVAPRLKIDRTKAAPPVRESVPDATDAEITDALALVNQDAVYDAERANWTVEEWDKVSPINGVPAEHFLSRHDVNDTDPTAKVYLIKQNGNVVMFQPHDPEQSGHVKITDVALVGGKHADNIAAGRSAAQVVEQVKQNILNKRAGKI